MNNTIETNQSYQKFKEILTAGHIINQWLSIGSVFSKLFQIVKLFQFVSSYFKMFQMLLCQVSSQPVTQ